MELALACSLVILTGAVPAKLGADQAPAFATTVERGLDFLARDALAWKKDHNCVSCHHAGMMVWAMCEARQHGFAVNEPVLNDLTRWVAESGDGTTGVPRPPGIPRALN